ncbi:MAG: LD-carboxypeptidase [Candidatus Melainabacteria bacterium]|nr:MAG: LD-carboxypeptidase [Candidatus Melainabacteria bacterium]
MITKTICINPRNILKIKDLKLYYQKTFFDNIDGISGSVQTRLKNLHSFFSNENIDAIFCARGGFGTLKLVNYIDYELIKNNPKIFVGFSDITNLNAMFYKKSNLLTFYDLYAVR